MQALVDFFVGLWDVLQGIFHYYLDLWKDVVYIVQLCMHFISNLPSYFAWLPHQYYTVILAIFGVVVVYKIAGREG